MRRVWEVLQNPIRIRGMKMKKYTASEFLEIAEIRKLNDEQERYMAQFIKEQMTCS